MKTRKKQVHFCSFCGLKGLCKSRLEHHIRKHTRERPFYCDKCQRGFLSKSTLSRHIRRQHLGEKTENSAKKHKCSICSYAAHWKSSLSRHMSTHTNERSFPCQHPGCEYASKSSTQLQMHVTHRHKNERKYLCAVPNCGYRGKTKFVMRSHSITHSEGRPFVCDYEGCSRQTKTKRALKNHKLLMHSEGRPFFCDYEGCSYRTKTNGALKVHKLGMHSRGYKLLACSLCDYRTARESNLRTHYLTHVEEKSVQCEFRGCLFSCKSRAHLRKHVLNCHSEKKLKCDVSDCLFSTANLAVLKAHEKYVHSSMKEYECPHCHFRGANPYNMRRHIANHKTNSNQRVPCPIEGCTFQAKSRMFLKRHLQFHEENLSCLVEGCGYVGRSTSSWKRHMQLHDPTCRPFHCPLCPKHFYAKHILSNHLRYHTEEKPFKCPACHYGSVRKGDAIRHVRRDHPTLLPHCVYDKQSNCDHCGVNYGCAVGLVMHRIKLKTAVVVLRRLQIQLGN